MLVVNISATLEPANSTGARKGKIATFSKIFSFALGSTDTFTREGRGLGVVTQETDTNEIIRINRLRKYLFISNDSLL